MEKESVCFGGDIERQREIEILMEGEEREEEREMERGRWDREIDRYGLINRVCLGG